jgi:hypothetical protein
VLLEQVTEFSDLLLQGSDLCLQGGKRRGQGGQWRGQGSENGRRGFGGGQRRQGALMQAGELAQEVLTEAVFTTIAGMGLQREMRLGQPAMQRFGVDA